MALHGGYSELKQDLQVIDENINLLEKQYTEFFDGIIYLEPKALRARTDALVRKWWGKPIANTQLQFKVKNIVQRYNAYKEKWNRQLRIKIRNDKEDVLE